MYLTNVVQIFAEKYWLFLPEIGDPGAIPFAGFKKFLSYSK
jgi:hypothetical protein